MKVRDIYPLLHCSHKIFLFDKQEGTNGKGDTVSYEEFAFYGEREIVGIYACDLAHISITIE